MSGEVDAQIEELCEQARVVPRSRVRVALIEEAIQLADAHRLADRAYSLRKWLVEETTLNGQGEKALVAFSWCLAHADRDPDHQDWHRLLWQYKWIAPNLPAFPEIERERIESVAEDMSRRFARLGASANVIAHKRCMIALQMGDFEEAERFHREWAGSERGLLSDCPACELNEQVYYQAMTGGDDEAYRLAAPILRDELSCEEIPHLTLATLLGPLTRLGRFDVADRLQRRGIALIRGKPLYIGRIGAHLSYLAIRGRLLTGCRVFESHLGIALETREVLSRFHFLLGAWFLLQRHQRVGRNQIRLRLSPAFPEHRDCGLYEVDALADWFRSDLLRIAELFDRRNGNRYHSRLVAEVARWHDLVSPAPRADT